MKRKCPICKEELAEGLEGKFAPFCSERCQLVDLNGWLTEAYKMPDNSDPDTTEEE